MIFSHSILFAMAAIQQAPADLRMFEEMRGNLDRINTLQYEFKAVAENEKSKIEYKCSFASQGKMHYVFAEIDNPDAPAPFKRTFAYDGRLYQDYDGLSGFLGKSAEIAMDRPYFLPQPLNDMFEFAYLPKELHNLTTLQEKTRWEELAKRAKRTGSKKVGDWDCDVLTIAPMEGEGADDKITVALAKTLHDYPVEVTIASEKTKAERRVLETKTLKTAKGDVVFPVKYQAVITPKDGGASTTFRATVDPDSLKINEKILDSKFTLK